MKFKLLRLLFLLLPINTSPVYSQIWETDRGFEQEDRYNGTYSNLYDYIEILYDSTGALTYKDITLNHLTFNKNNTKEGYRYDEVYWLKTSIKGSALEDGKYLFSIGLNIATWPAIDVYIQEGDSVRSIKTGFKRTPGEKVFLNGFSFFWLELKADEQKTIYARLDPEGGFWNQRAAPKTISIYFFDPSSIDKLNGTYLLRNFENDPVRKGGYPRLSNLYDITQIYPDTSCNMNLEDVIKDWDSRSLFYVGPLEKNTCYWAHLKVVNPDSVNQFRIFNFPYGRQRITCYIAIAGNRFEAKTVGNRTDQDVLFLNIPPQDTLSIYFRYPIQAQSILPLLNIQDIYEKDYFSSQRRTTYKFFLLGALFLPFLFFLIQFLMQKDMLTFYYLVFLLGSTLYLISILDQILFFQFSPKVLKYGIQIKSFYSILFCAAT